MGAEAQSVPAATKLFNQANEILGYLQTSNSVCAFSHIFIVHGCSVVHIPRKIIVVHMLTLSFLLVNIDMTCWIFAPMGQKKSWIQQ